MRKRLFTAFFVLIFCALKSQQVPNAGFDNWTNPLHPDSWTSIEEIFGFPYNVVTFQDTIDKIQGRASLKLVTDTLAGYPYAGIIDGLVESGSGTRGGPEGITFSGIPFRYRPDTFSFYYKYTSPGIDTADVSIEFSQAGDTTPDLRSGFPLLVDSNWTLVTIPLDGYYIQNNIPDSLYLVFLSSNTVHPVIGSTLHIDSMRFGYNPMRTIVTPGIRALGPTMLCSGDSVVLKAGTNPVYSYQWELNGRPIPGATDSVYVVNYSGVFTVRVDSQGIFGASHVITVTVIPPINFSYSVSLCPGQAYDFNGHTLSTAGSYFAIFTSASGCDSNVVVRLQINSVIDTNIQATVCQGTPYVFKGHFLSASGTYLDTLTAWGGCDSITILHFVIDSVPPITWAMPSDTFCSNAIPVYLNNASPPGGVYYGIGVNNNTFAPFSVGIGTYPVTYQYTSTSGCSDSLTNVFVVVNCTVVTGVEDPETEPGIQVYPNPADGYVHITSRGSFIEGEFNMFDLTGRRVYVQTVTDMPADINISTLPAGAYLWRLNGKEAVKNEHGRIVIFK